VVEDTPRDLTRRVLKSTQQDVARAVAKDQVGPCSLTPSLHSSPRACFQRLKLKYAKMLSNVAFNFNLRHYDKAKNDKRKFEADLLKKREAEIAAVSKEVKAGLGRKCSKYPSTHFEPSFLESNSNL